MFTLGLLAVYRIGAYIPTPGIDSIRFQEFFTRNAAGGFLGYFDLFSGGMLRRMTIFASGHHAVYHCFHHSAVIDGGYSDTR